jgi:hypothetical protein
MQQGLSGKCVMDNTKKLLINIGGVLVFSVIGALLVMAVDPGGTRWLKFILYLVFFASFSSLAVRSSSYSCSGTLPILRK